MKKKEARSGVRSWPYLLSLSLSSPYFLLWNSLQETWVSEGSGDKIEITDDDQMIIRPEEGDQFTEIGCNVDTKSKILTVAEGSPDSDIIQPGTYNYHIEQDTLTLTEREYGEQLVCVREQE